MLSLALGMVIVIVWPFNPLLEILYLLWGSEIEVAYYNFQSSS